MGLGIRLKSRSIQANPRARAFIAFSPRTVLLDCRRLCPVPTMILQPVRVGSSRHHLVPPAVRREASMSARFGQEKAVYPLGRRSARIHAVIPTQS